MPTETRLDARLREAFGVEDEWRPLVDLDSVRSAARRSSAQRAGALAAAVTLVVSGTALALSRGGGEDADPVGPPLAPTSSAPVEVLAVQGEWVSAPLTERRVRAVLEEAGLGQFTDAVTAEVRPGARTLLLLHVDGGFVDLKVQRGRMKPDYLDRQTYLAGEGLLELTPREGEGRSRFAWEVSDSGELTLTLTSSSEPDVDGVPAAAYLRAFYSAVPFAPAG